MWENQNVYTHCQHNILCPFKTRYSWHPEPSVVEHRDSSLKPMQVGLSPENWGEWDPSVRPQYHSSQAAEHGTKLLCEEILSASGG
jgi:hypothetical protein